MRLDHLLSKEHARQITGECPVAVVVFESGIVDEGSRSGLFVVVSTAASWVSGCPGAGGVCVESGCGWVRGGCLAHCWVSEGSGVCLVSWVSFGSGLAVCRAGGVGGLVVCEVDSGREHLVIAPVACGRPGGWDGSSSSGGGVFRVRGWARRRGWCGCCMCDFMVSLWFLLSVCATSYEGHMVDALASRADEGRWSLR